MKNNNFECADVERWIMDRCDLEKAAIFPVYSLHAEWRSWCVRTKQFHFIRFSLRRFVRHLETLGFSREQYFGEDCFVGLRIKGRVSVTEEWILEDKIKSRRRSSSLS